VKHLYLFGFLLLLPFFGFSQGEFNNWLFGWYFPLGTGITFNFGDPVVIPNGVMTTGQTSVSVSDSIGNLLFFSDGANVYNRNRMMMPNGSLDFNVSGGYEQPVVSIPKPDDDSSYYIFNVGSYELVGPSYGLEYSIVDMRLNGGLGDIDILQKNIHVAGAGKAWRAVTGTRHADNKRFWIVTTIDSTNLLRYASYLVDQNGIHVPPVFSTSYFQGTLPNPAPPYIVNPWSIRISPDATKLITVRDDIREYCSFNSNTGKVTHLFFIPNDTLTGQGNVEFSIDSKLLYCSYGVYSLPGVAPGEIFQFDATKVDSLTFIQSRIRIDSSNARSALQMGPNWKIYGTENGKDSLCVINSPSVQGAGCNLVRNAVGVASPTSDGFPQYVLRYKAYIHYFSTCQGSPIHFTGDIWPPADSIHWDFGDPASGAGNFSNLPNPMHIYNSTGSYVVELFVRHIDNRTDTSWQTINIVSAPQVALGPDRSICVGDSVTFDAGACSGCTYLWKDLGTGLPVGASQTFKTGLAGSYSVTVTNSNGCIGRDTVQLTTTPIPSVTNNKLTDTICSGESTNIPLTSVPTGANFHWTATLTSGTVIGFSPDSGLVINQVLTDLLPTPGIVTYHITPKIGSCTGATVDFQVTVNPGVPVTVSISESQNNVCAGSMVTFTATPGNQGSNPVYSWKVNGINQPGNSITYSYSPANNDVVTCVLTSSNTTCTSNNPATSNSITMTVNPNLPVSITISQNPSVVCQGQTVTFTATPTHGGTTPSYQWYLNSNPAGTNSDTYTFTPVNGDLVSCTLTSNETCTTNNPASSIQHQVSVTPLTPVSVTITPSQNPFCAGSSVTFNANPNGGGLTPSYQWKVNGVNAGGGTSVFTYTPVAGDIVCCVLNSSLPCVSGNPATSNCITMIVDTGLPAGVSINAVPNPFCPGSSVTITATPSNGGPLPTYQWKVNGINTGTNSTYTYNPVNGDSVRCIMTSNLSCVTGNPASSSKIILSGTLAPIVTFSSCFDTITTINAKPIKLKGGIPLGGTYSGPGVNSGNGTFAPALAGVGTKTITYSYTNAALCSASKSISILNLPSSIFSCGNNFLDVRDNKTYATIQIGSQCWLASNLNFGTILASFQDQRDNCIAEKYCYNDNPLNCTNHGGLYQWDEVMRFDETPADQGYCPPGWHIPSENDWNILFAVYINNGFAGSPLKYSGYSGFNALLSGARHINRGWDFNGFATFFWSSTPRSDNKAWAHGMNEVDPSVSLYPSSRVNAFSVRCLKD
jgi:uncharacterized protein (TIGR02145 family)